MAVAVGLVTRWSRVGAWNTSDLPLAVPVLITRLWPWPTSSSPMAWCRYSWPSPVWAFTASQAGLAVSQAGASPWRASWPGMVISS